MEENVGNQHWSSITINKIYGKIISPKFLLAKIFVHPLTALSTHLFFPSKVLLILLVVTAPHIHWMHSGDFRRYNLGGPASQPAISSPASSSSGLLTPCGLKQS